MTRASEISQSVNHLYRRPCVCHRLSRLYGTRRANRKKKIKDSQNFGMQTLLESLSILCAVLFEIKKKTTHSAIRRGYNGSSIGTECTMIITQPGICVQSVSNDKSIAGDIAAAWMVPRNFSLSLCIVESHRFSQSFIVFFLYSTANHDFMRSNEYLLLDVNTHKLHVQERRRQNQAKIIGNVEGEWGVGDS